MCVLFYVHTVAQDRYCVLSITYLNNFYLQLLCLLTKAVFVKWYRRYHQNVSNNRDLPVYSPRMSRDMMTVKMGAELLTVSAKDTATFFRLTRPSTTVVNLEGGGVGRGHQFMISQWEDRTVPA